MTTNRNITLILSAIAVFVAATVGAQGFESVFPTDADAAGQPLQVTGTLGTGFRLFLEEESGDQLEVSPEARIRGVASSAQAEAALEVRVLPSVVDPLSASRFSVDEAYTTAFLGSAVRLSAGIMKREWGVGDGVHAVDVVGTQDRSQGPVTDYWRSMIPEPMISLMLGSGSAGSLELVYKPFFQPTRVALTGRWAVVDPAAAALLVEAAEPDRAALQNFQVASRATRTFGPVDLGVVYYYGFMPEAGYRFETEFVGTNPLDPTDYETTAEQVWTRANLGGLHAAAVLGAFTLRGEAGYWFSEDSDGSSPALYNSRFAYLAGGDLLIPGTSALVGVQVTGSITAESEGLAPDDVDSARLYDGTSSSTLIVANLEAPFARDRVRVRLAGAYSPEAEGYFILPECSVTVGDNYEAILSATIIGSVTPNDSVYDFWQENDSVELTFRYRF